MQLAGIEPALRTWEARILPLNYSCVFQRKSKTEDLNRFVYLLAYGKHL